MTSFETEAANLLIQYKKVVDFAIAKNYRKWKGYLIARGDFAAFQREDIEQFAREGMLILGGLIPNTKRVSISGTLQKLEAEGGERYVQAALDQFVAEELSRTSKSFRAASRGGPVESHPLSIERELERADSMDEVAQTWVNGQLPGEVSPDGAAIRERFPILCLMELDGKTWREAAEALGIKPYVYTKRRRAELEDFKAWAVANRRVLADAA